MRKAKELKPDVVVLIDSPDYNLRMAPRFKQLGIPVVFALSARSSGRGAAAVLSGWEIR